MIIVLVITHVTVAVAAFVYGKKRGAAVGQKISAAAEAVKKAAS